MFAERLQASVAMRGIKELLDGLEGMGACKDKPIAVERLLRDFTPSARWLRPLFRFARGRYTRTLLHRTENFELLLLCWDKHARTPVHGHAGQMCWFTPVLGAFDFDNFRQVEGEPGKAGYARLVKTASSRNVGSGMFDRRDEVDDLHQVRVAEGYDRAVSLHLYAAPIDECLAYDLLNQRANLVRMRYEFVRGVRAIPAPGFERPSGAPGWAARTAQTLARWSRKPGLALRSVRAGAARLAGPETS